MSQDQFRSFEGTWERISQVAVQGAQYDSRERQPHPKCLEGTRVDLLNHIHTILDDREKSHLIWLHGTAGVGKSAVAFNVAERMRGLKVTEQTNVEKRLAGTFFFSRKHTTRCTTGYFFATLVYQLASNFPSIQSDVNRSIRNNPALLDPNNSLRDQMEALFLQPLRRLRLRLRGCPPLTFIVDALDECTSEPELADLILLLARALREPDLPVTHILLTSRSESHICKAFRRDEVRPLVCEIPVKTSGDGVASIISLDGTDVDNDIYIFLRHSFAELESRHPHFPRPSRDELEWLASRAGRRFIVASTMMKFIDDGDSDPHDRLQLMLELTSELLPGTEVYKLYDCILSTCANPKRAYLHLSVVAALADPLPMSQITKLLGPGQGRDVETALMQLRSVIDIPTDSNLPVNIYHSSVRDYVSDPLNCSIPRVHDIPSPHSLLAHSSLRLMMKEIPESTTLLDALLELKRHSQAMEPQEPQRLKDSLGFLVRLPEPLSVLISMLWLRGYHRSDLRSWVETVDGHAWLQTQGGGDWLKTQGGKDWLRTRGGRTWLRARACDHLLTRNRENSLEIQHRRYWPQTRAKQDWLQTQDGQHWLQTEDGRNWLQTQGGLDWLQTLPGRSWLQTLHGRSWLQNMGGRVWLQTLGGRNWLQTWSGRDWLQSQDGQDWLQSQGARDWLQTLGGRHWLQTPDALDWLQTQGARDWLQTRDARDWLQTLCGRGWLQTWSARSWLQTQGGRGWLQTPRGRDWLQTPHGQGWQSTPDASVWVTMEEFSSTLQAISEYTIVPDLPLLPALQAVQQFKNLPDFLMFPVFLALRHQDHSSFALPEGLSPPDREIIHAINAFTTFANEAQKHSRSASDALKYACHNWAIHLLRASNPWDDMLNHIFHAFWNRHLLSWLERQWCLRGLRSCLVVLSEGQKLVKPNKVLPVIVPDPQKPTIQASAPSFPSETSTRKPSTPVLTHPAKPLVAPHANVVPRPLPPIPSPKSESHVGTFKTRTSDQLQTNRPLELVATTPSRFKTPQTYKQILLTIQGESSKSVSK